MTASTFFATFKVPNKKDIKKVIHQRINQFCLLRPDHQPPRYVLLRLLCGGRRETGRDEDNPLKLTLDYTRVYVCVCERVRRVSEFV